MFEVPTTPVLVVDGSRESQREISHAPYTVGRQPGSDILLEDAFVSRKHAEIVYENGSFYIVDQGSKHGTYLNGAPVKRHKLSNNDAVHFGKPDGPFIRFGVRSAQSSSTLRELLGPLKAESSTSNTAIEKLSWLLEANRKLNNEGAVDQILTALVETTLTLTKVERGYVMLRDPASGALKLIVGLDSKGKLLNDDSTISHSAIKQALQGTRRVHRNGHVERGDGRTVRECYCAEHPDSDLHSPSQPAECCRFRTRRGTGCALPRQPLDAGSPDEG